jgi:hypothetical protein
VLQCNEEHWIERSDPETFRKASLFFNVDLVHANGFPHVMVVERRGSNRPLVIARTRAGASERIGADSVCSIRAIGDITPCEPVGSRSNKWSPEPLASTSMRVGKGRLKRSTRP